MKRLWTPIILLALIGLLAGLAYWDDRRTSTDKLTSETKSKLLSFKIEDITAVEVSNSAAIPPNWSLKKDGKFWKIASPFSYAADSEGVERLLKILADAKYERQFDVGDQGIAGFGLDHPQLSYRLTDKNGTVNVFAVGSKSPTGFSSYVKTSDDRHVYIVNQYIYTASNKSLMDVRDRSLSFPEAKSVTAFQVTFTGRPELSLKHSDKDWQILAPFAAKADDIEISKYLNGWERLRVSEFLDSPGPELRKALTVLGKGTREYLRVRFEQAAGAPREVTVVENNGKLYVPLSGGESFGELDRKQVDALNRTATDLQDNTMFSFLTTDVTDFDVDGAAYQRDKNSWINTASKKSAEFVQGILVSLEFAKAVAKISKDQGDSLTHSPALHTVTIKQGAKVLTQFSVWSKSGDGATLVLKNGETYYLVDSEFLNILQPKPQNSGPTAASDLKNEKS